MVSEPNFLCYYISRKRVASSPPEQGKKIFLKISVLTFSIAQQLFWKYKHVKSAAILLPPTVKPVLIHFLNFDKNFIVWAWDAIPGQLHERQNSWGRYPLHYQCMNAESWHLSHMLEHTSHAQLIFFWQAKINWKHMKNEKYFGLFHLFHKLLLICTKKVLVTYPQKQFFHEKQSWPSG